MTKKQAREVARRWIGGAALSFFPDIDTLSEDECQKITDACVELGERLLRNDPYLTTLEEIIYKVVNEPGNVPSK